MSIIEKWKLRKIKKLRTATDSEKAIEKYLKDDKWEVKMAAIEALEYIATDSASEILINRLETSYGMYSSPERIINALGKINNGKAINFIRQIYADGKNREVATYYLEYAKFAKRVLNKKGSPVVILDRINELDSKILYNDRTISDDKTIKTLCNKIKKHINREKHLIQILSETKIPEIANEALNKLTDLNIITTPYIEEIIFKGVISKNILERISEPKLFVEIFDGYIFTTNKKSKLIISKLKELKINFSIINIQIDCEYCDGKGNIEDVERLSELSIYMGMKPKVTTHKCPECNGKGKKEFKKFQIEC